MMGAVYIEKETEAEINAKVSHNKLPDLSLFALFKAHPWLSTALMTILCLFIGQAHKVVNNNTVTSNGTSGELIYIKGVAAIVVAALCLMAFTAFLTLAVPRHSRRYLYGLAGGALAFLAVRGVLAVDDGALYYIALSIGSAFLFLFSYLEIKGLRASVFLACALFSVLPVFGFGRLFYIVAVFITAVYLFYDGRSLGTVRRVAASAAFLLSAALAYYLYSNGDDLVTGTVYAILSLCMGSLLTAAIAKKLTADLAFGMMLVAGFALRLGYDLHITLPQNQHDVFPLTSTHPRHNSYIWHIYENLSLPTEKVYNAGLSQYYHPPLHHFLSALWMRFQNALGIDAYAAYENVQYLMLFCSAAMTVAADKLFGLFNIKGGLRLSLVAVIAFHPTMIFLAGSVNNDTLATLLLFLAVLYTVRWYKEQSVANTLGLALTIGGAMLTKLSGAVVAIGTAYVMLYRLFESKNGFVNNFKRLWKRFVLFGAVCFPLGLWWPIRCRLLYGMPFGYVPSLTPNADQYLQGYNLFERLTGVGSLNLGNVFPTIGRTLYDGTAGSDYDYGILPYAVKSSLFGEYFWKTGVSSAQNVLAQVMFYCALALIVISIAGLFCGLYATLLGNKNGAIPKNPFLKTEEKVTFRFFLIYFAALFGSYAMFCIKYPFTCTMDFRYIVPTLLIGAMGTGVLLRGDSVLKKRLTAVNGAFTLVFCLSTCAFFLASW